MWCGSAPPLGHCAMTETARRQTRTAQLPPAADGAPAPGDTPGSGNFLLRFLRLAGPFFTSEERWMAWGLLSGVLALTLLQIAIAVRLNLWNRDFFNSLDSRDWGAFLRQMAIFAALAAATMGVAGYQVYVRQLLQLRSRRWLTGRLVDRWLRDDRYYRLASIEPELDNPYQRISEN